MPNEVKVLFEKSYDEVTMAEAIVMSFFDKEEGFKRIDYLRSKKEGSREELAFEEPIKAIKKSI